MLLEESAYLGRYMGKVNFIRFMATRDHDGYSAHAIGFPIFTQGDTFEELQANVREALDCHFDGEADVSKISFDITVPEPGAANG